MPQYVEVKGQTIEFPDGMPPNEIEAAIKKNMLSIKSPLPEKSFGEKVLQQSGNLLAGGVRGAGSIGATLMAPADILKDAVAGKGLSLESNRERRQQMDEALRTLGADTDSLAFKGGKLGGEIAGTMGVGGALAKPLQALSNTRFASGIEPLIEGATRALQTGGFRVGPLAGTGAGTAARVLGGATVGGASAGLVNPEDAGMGALIGGALPAATQLAGLTGSAIKSKLANPSTLNDTQKMAAAQAALKAGFVIPPADLQPNMGTELLSGLSGKIKTAQVASQKNQAVTDTMARKALGLAPDDVVNAETLQGIRNQAAQAYGPVKQAGLVKVDPAFNKALDTIEQTYKGANAAFPGLAKDEVGQMVNALRVGEFDSGGAVDAVKVLREQADKAFRSGDKGLGKAAKEAADAVENQLERHLSANGNDDALSALRDARKLIAKTYSVQKGLNATTGSVDAQALAKQLAKGKPLSDELLQIAQIAQAFPKATQALKEAPKAVSPLDWFGATATSGVTGNPLPMLGLAARPAARSYLLSPMAQRAAMRQGLLSNPEEMTYLTQALRSAPVLASDR